ncbi:MAG: glutamate--tRNA ligase, partial [Patescibacteria group bacterium]
MIKTRFAPSPTGFLHVGGLRTALFSYLFAKKHSGTFIVRIEDTDQERFVEGGIENIIRSLEWGGIKADEGVWINETRNKKLEIGEIIEIGSSGPYIQSKRLEIYKKFAEQLIDSDHAYYCFCTKERLDEVRKIQEASKQPTMYDGNCRKLSVENRKLKIENREPFVIRMKMPKEGSTSFVDVVRGKVEFENKLIDDQVLIKSDGYPTYHLAVVVDDHLMGITHVIRGEEWLPSTPKHIVLYQMFGWQPPEFAHLPLLVNEQKQKLSKRHGDVSVEDFKAKGYLPEAIVNFIAFLGWNPGDERELFTLTELEKEFDLSRVSKSAAVFNREKLDWYNQQYIRKLEIGELTNACLPYLVNAGLLKEQGTRNKEQLDFLEKAIALINDRMVTVADAPTMLGFLFADELEYEPDLLVWKKSTKEKTKEILLKLAEFLQSITKNDWVREELEQKVGEWVKENSFGTGDVLWPMRVALSGEKNSPGPYEIAGV